jgi:hypothetical protein
MAKEDFFLSVRNAVRFVAPRVEADGPYDDLDKLKKMLRAATIWLTPKSVAEYDPQDFASLPREEWEALEKDVSAFGAVARDVPPQQPATREQVQAALPPFLKVVKAVRKIMRDEWTGAAGELIEQARHWAEARNWPTSLYAKKISEDFIGTYELNRLIFAAQGAQLLLNPVGRFVSGADGMVEMAVLPAYDSVTVVRQEGRWRIGPLPGQKSRRDWSKAAFVEAAEMLARLA